MNKTKKIENKIILVRNTLENLDKILLHLAYYEWLLSNFCWYSSINFIFSKWLSFLNLKYGFKKIRRNRWIVLIHFLYKKERKFNYIGYSRYFIYIVICLVLLSKILIIFKVLCQRLNACLHSLISETQSDFVPGKLISHNIIIAQELFHGLMTNKSCQDKFMVIKTYMSKAYDRAEWIFIQELLCKMEFDHHWTQLMMECNSSVQ